MRRLTAFVFMAAAFWTAGGLWADDQPAAGPPLSFGMTAALGTETIKGDNFQSLGLLPDFGVGPLGVGIDLTIHFKFYDHPGGTFGFYPRAEDWYDSSLNFQQNLDKYLSRILYLRWGHKGDPLYAQLGLLPSTTLGSGFVVGGYNNGALRPTYNYAGLELDASGELVGLPFFGFESFVSNLSTWDLLGGRAYIKPFALANSDSKFLQAIEVGFTLVTDLNPYAQTPSSYSSRQSGTVLVTGVDTMVPLVSNEIFSAVATADADLQGSHAGGEIGVGGKLISVIQWGAQTRFLSDDFLPDYFDRAYEVNRVFKFQVYNGTTTVPGTIGWSLMLGAGFLDDAVNFGTQLSGPFAAQSDVYAQPQLSAWAKLKPGVLPVSAEAYYTKNGLTDFAALTSAQNALIGAKVGYTMGAVTLSIIYDLRYVAAGESGYNGQNWISTSRVETAVKF